MKDNFKTILITALCIISFVLAPFSEIQAEAKSEKEKIIELTNLVRPYDLLWKESQETEIGVVLANTKPKVERETLSPDKIAYNEYRLSDFEKTSKNLFGKVIELDIAKKRNNQYPVMYYNSKNKTIYMPLDYDPGDIMAFTKHREVKKTNDGFEVTHYDVKYHWAETNRRPNRLTKIKIKPSNSSKYGYIITEIEREDFDSSRLNLSKKTIDEQMKQIKKWYGKPTKADKKEGFEKDGVKYSLLYHDGNLVFVLKNDGKKLFRYYYKYGVLIHAIESTVKENKTLKEYKAYFKDDLYYINKHNIFGSPDLIEDLIELVKQADQTLEILATR